MIVSAAAHGSSRAGARGWPAVPLSAPHTVADAGGTSGRRRAARRVARRVAFLRCYKLHNNTHSNREDGRKDEEKRQGVERKDCEFFPFFIFWLCFHFQNQ